MRKSCSPTLPNPARPIRPLAPSPTPTESSAPLGKYIVPLAALLLQSGPWFCELLCGKGGHLIKTNDLLRERALIRFDCSPQLHCISCQGSFNCFPPSQDRHTTPKGVIFQKVTRKWSVSTPHNCSVLTEGEAWKEWETCWFSQVGLKSEIQKLTKFPSTLRFNRKCNFARPTHSDGLSWAGSDRL